MGIFTTVANKVGHGGDDNNENKSTYQGDHNLSLDTTLQPTDDNVINPLNQNNWDSVRTQSIVTSPTYFTKEQADNLNQLAKQKRLEATQTERAYKSLNRIEKADTRVHKAHRGYQKTVASCERDKQLANASLARKLHHLRPQYVQMGKGIEQAQNKANTRITELKAKVGAAM